MTEWAAALVCASTQRSYFGRHGSSSRQDGCVTVYSFRPLRYCCCCTCVVLLAGCRFKTLLGPLEAIFQKPETTILERLRVRQSASKGDRGGITEAEK